MRYIIALDQGTTSSRAVVFDETGRSVAQHNVEFKQVFPQPGWVEHAPEDILSSQIEALRTAFAESGADLEDIAAIGITNQRETTVVWEKATGKPVCNAIVWQCRRTAPLIERLKQDGLGNIIRDKTGLVPDAYFSGTKLQWILDRVPGLRARAEKGEVLFGTVDSFLAFSLSQEHVHVTDATNASRTMLFNIHEMQWDADLLRALNIPRAMMPKVVDSSGIVGTLDPSILGKAIPIAAMAGDQHAALFGQACFAPGMAKNTYGTGCFLLMNTGSKPVRSENSLVTTVAWQLDGKPSYALEGSVFVAGAAIQWLRDEMQLISASSESEAIAASLSDNGGVYLVPAFTGLGAPYWDMYGRGTIVGLTRGTGRRHIVRAALESIAYQTNDVLSAMKRDSGMESGELRVDGGASANNFLMRFQSGISGVKVIRPRVIETTAMGAAMLAGRAVGLWDDAALGSIWQKEIEFEPDMEPDTRMKLLRDWEKAVSRAGGWAEPD